MTMLFLFLFLLSYTSVQASINVFVNEQYLAVARAEEYVQPDGSPNTAPSVFIGLIHIAVTPLLGGSTFTLSTTLWHNVAAATIVYINGPAAPGALPPSVVPLLTLVSGPAARSICMNPVLTVNVP